MSALALTFMACLAAELLLRRQDRRIRGALRPADIWQMAFRARSTGYTRGTGRTWEK